MTAAANIAAALGAAHHSGTWWRCRCPVHNSGGATLALRDGDRALIVKCHAGCDRRDVLAELRRRGLLADAARPEAHGGGTSRRAWSEQPVRQQRVVPGDHAKRTAVAQQIWDRAVEAAGTPIATYLTCRGITIPPPASLRWASSCWCAETASWLPAMVAAIVDVDGKFRGLHRTYLRSDGSGKAAG